MYLSLSSSSWRKKSILFWFMQKEWIFPSNASVAVIISQKLIFVRASTSLMKVQSVATLSLAPLMMMLSLPQHTFAHLAHDNEEDVWDKFVKREDNLSKQKFFILSVLGGGEDDAGSIKGWGSRRMSERSKQKHDVNSHLAVCSCVCNVIAKSNKHMHTHFDHSSYLPPTHLASTHACVCVCVCFNVCLSLEYELTNFQKLLVYFACVMWNIY